jgi:hypothetical protein
MLSLKVLIRMVVVEVSLVLIHLVVEVMIHMLAEVEEAQLNHMHLPQMEEAQLHLPQMEEAQLNLLHLPQMEEEEEKLLLLILWLVILWLEDVEEEIFKN